MQSEKNIKEFLSSTNPKDSIVHVDTLGGKLSVNCENNASIDQKYNFTKEPLGEMSRYKLDTTSPDYATLLRDTDAYINQKNLAPAATPTPPTPVTAKESDDWETDPDYDSTKPKTPVEMPSRQDMAGVSSDLNARMNSSTTNRIDAAAEIAATRAAINPDADIPTIANNRAAFAALHTEIAGRVVPKAGAEVTPPTTPPPYIPSPPDMPPPPTTPPATPATTTPKPKPKPPRTQQKSPVQPNLIKSAPPQKPKKPTAKAPTTPATTTATTATTTPTGTPTGTPTQPPGSMEKIGLKIGEGLYNIASAASTAMKSAADTTATAATAANTGLEAAGSAVTTGAGYAAKGIEAGISATTNLGKGVSVVGNPPTSKPKSFAIGAATIAAVAATAPVSLPAIATALAAKAAFDHKSQIKGAFKGASNTLKGKLARQGNNTQEKAEHNMKKMLLHRKEATNQTSSLGKAGANVTALKVAAKGLAFKALSTTLKSMAGKNAKKHSANTKSLSKNIKQEMADGSTKDAKPKQKRTPKSTSSS